MANSLECGRESYQPSGKVRWGRFLVGGLATLAVGAGLGLLLAFWLRPGHTVKFIEATGSGLPVVPLVFATVVWSHCRNPRLAAGLGLAAGLATIRGAFTTDFSETWYYFVGQTAMAAVLAASLAAMRASRAYCEQTHQWMIREPAKFSAGVGDLLTQAVETGRLKELLDALTPLPVAANQYCELLVEYVPASRRAAGAKGDADDLVYLTIREVVNAATPTKPIARFPTELARQWKLTEEEIVALAAKFPGLQRRQQRTATDADVRPGLEGPAAVWPVPWPYGGRVLTWGHLLFATVLCLGSVFLVPFVGFCVMLGMIFLLGEATVAKIFLVMGFLVAWLVFQLWLGFRFTHLVTDRFWYHTIRRQLRRRPDRLVDPDDPEAMFVEVVPRRNWNRVMLDSMDDLGFIRVERGRNYILFEGDRERYRIPTSSLLSCDVEGIALGEGNAGLSGHYYVVLRARVNGIDWEAPLARRHIELIQMTECLRFQRARELRALLNSIHSESAECEAMETPC